MIAINIWTLLVFSIIAGFGFTAGKYLYYNFAGYMWNIKDKLSIKLRVAKNKWKYARKLKN